MSTRIPCGPIALPANCSFVDASWSHSVYTAYISGWMNNLIGEGENSTIHRNDSILFLIYAMSGMTSFSRDVSELSTENTTRSDQTQMYNNITLINVEEKSDEIENARNDLVRKFEWLPHYKMLNGVRHFDLPLNLCDRIVYCLLILI